jgi:hypothetical protein
MENNREVTLRKIPLKLFIEVLTDAWNKGADFVDIIGVPNELQDNIGIAIKEDYYSKGDKEEDEFDVDVHIDPSKKLDEEDLNQLI